MNFTYSVNKPGLFGDHATCCGVPDINHGVLDGLNVDGVEPAPKNIPVPLIKSGPIVLCISIPNLHFSASSKRSKQPANFKAQCHSKSTNNELATDLTCAHFRQLSHDNIFRHTTHRIIFSM